MSTLSGELSRADSVAMESRAGEVPWATPGGVGLPERRSGLRRNHWGPIEGARGGITRDTVEGPLERKEWGGRRGSGVGPPRGTVITGSQEGALSVG